MIQTLPDNTKSKVEIKILKTNRGVKMMENERNTIDEILSSPDSENIFQEALRTAPGVSFVDSNVAFQEALDEQRLSTNPSEKNYIHDYMYMLTFNGKHQFKSVTTRNYLD